MCFLCTSFLMYKIYKWNYAPTINLPALILNDLNQKPINISQFEGRPLVINFWGTWCGPCRQEMPILEAAKNKYSGRIRFIVVSDEPIYKLIQFKEANPYSFPYFQSAVSFQKMGITSVPITYFFDAKGKLVVKQKDNLKENELNEILKSLSD